MWSDCLSTHSGAPHWDFLELSIKNSQVELPLQRIPMGKYRRMSLKIPIIDVPLDSSHVFVLQSKQKQNH